MKQHANQHIMLFLILFCCTISMSFSQQNVEQYNTNGLTTTIFNHSLGKITVYIPEATANEKISGIIKVEAHGDSEKKKNKNKAELQKFQLSFGDVTIPLLSQTYVISVPESSSGSLSLLNEKGALISSSAIQANLSSTISNIISYVPEYVVAGEPAKIKYDCDGNLGNDTVSLNNVSVPILAESESAVFFKVPKNNIGKTQLQFTSEGKKVVATSIHVLLLDLAVGSSDLLRGEKTNLSINVSGLEDLETNVPITITNNSTSNITLEGGNVQQLIINPMIDAASGNYFKSLSIQALQRGNFSISVNVETPSPDTTVSYSEDLLCNCYLNGESYLLSSETCQELGGRCSDNVVEDTIDLDEMEKASFYSCEFPEEITANDDVVNLKVIDRNERDIVAVLFSYKSIDAEQWETIGTDNTIEDGIAIRWNPPLGNDGVNEISTQVVNKNNVISQNTQFIYLNVTPETLSDVSLNTTYSVSENDIRRALDRARAKNDQIKEEEEKLDELIRKLWDALDSKKENEDAKNELTTIDEVLDKIPNVYKDSLKVLVDSLANLRKQLPVKIDTLALKKAVDDAQKRLDDCNKRLEELKKEQEILEKERDDLKEQLDDTLEEIDRLHIDNGWTGGHGYHADGRPWYGYVGDENANTDINTEQYELRKKLRALRKPYLKALRRLEQLPDEIAAAQEDCDKLNEALEKAKKAAEKGDQFVATEVEVEDICRQIKSLLTPIWRWCVENPDHCNFREKLLKLIKECPKDSAALDVFWDEFDQAIKAKKEQEEIFGDDAVADKDAIDGIENDIKNAEDRIKDLKDQQRKDYLEAERKQKQRAQELEDARQRKREADARKIAAEKKKAAKPAPYLEEPVDPSDDQIKFQAQIFIFKRLYTDYLIDKGPCDCTTKALAFANNTNSIVTDLIGRIGVGVAFAPLEAFPGVSLGGRLGIGAVKALASSLFGGQSFSDELTKNLFDVIGGEIFPKLTGNDFTGNRINDLAGKGLEDILEAEGVRATSWEGKTKLANCGEVSGKTTILINPNTGWVTIMIKIDNCPLIVIKYKVDDDGVPISKPIVKQIKG